MNDLEMLRLEVLSMFNQNVKIMIATVKMNSEQTAELQADADKRREIISDLDRRQLLERKELLKIEHKILLNTANMLTNQK